MRGRSWSGLILGSLAWVLVACQAPEPAPAPPTASPTVGLAPERFATPRPLATTAAPTLPVTPAPLPATLTPGPTSTPDRPQEVLAPNGWQVVGNRDRGVQTALPPGWLDLSRLLSEAEAAARFGEAARFWAVDAKSTGLALLQDAPPSMGAFILAYAIPARSPDAVTALTTLLSEVDEATGPVRPAWLNRLPAAISDNTGDPLHLLGDSVALWRLRYVLLAPPEADHHLLLALGSDPASHAVVEPVFAAAMASIVLFPVVESAGEEVPGEAITATLQNGDLIEGSVAVASALIYAFEAEGGTFVSLIAEPAESIDLRLALIDPAGKTIGFSDSGFAGNAELLLDVPLPRSGRYFIKVDEYFAQPGDFTLSLRIAPEPLYETGGQLAFGQAVSGELRANERHRWNFSATTGERVSIVLRPESEQLDVVLRLVGPDGQPLVELDEGFSGDAEIIVGYVLPVTSEYIIEVKDFSGRGGAYRLSLDEGGEETLGFYDAGDLRSGDVRDETLQASEAHTWFFSGFAGDNVTLVVTPAGNHQDLEIWLLDPDLERLAMIDENLAGEPEQLTADLPAAGQYLVLVREYTGAVGRYTITFVVNGNDRLELMGPLSDGRPVNRRLTVGRAALWTFTAAVDERISLQLTPLTAQGDLVLSVRDPAGQIVLTLDEGGNGVQEEVVDLPITIPGQWQILVEEFLDRGGPYRLQLSRQSPGP